MWSTCCQALGWASLCLHVEFQHLYLRFARRFLKRDKSVRPSQVTTAGAAASGGFSINSLMMKLPDGSAGGLVGISDLLGPRGDELGLFESHGWGCSLC